MKIHQTKISLDTKNSIEVINITGPVTAEIKKIGVKNGYVIISVLHTTACVFVNEDEEGLASDFELIPKLVAENENLCKKFEHNETCANAVAHISASIIGPGKTLSIQNGELVLGTWQRVLFFELDGPRQNREIHLNIIGE
jgi:secondary thiamine-phosphate synthase enzyme